MIAGRIVMPAAGGPARAVHGLAAKAAAPAGIVDYTNAAAQRSDAANRHHHHYRRAKVIHPGGWHVDAERPISTLLGSCVAVCLYDPTLGLGGMNHFLLPQLRRKEHRGPNTLLSGDFAMETLLNAMLKRGARKERLIAKAFGGGNIVDLRHFEIGLRNAEFAESWLRLENITLQGTDFGGAYARTVVLLPDTGEALCKRTPTRALAALRQLDEREARYQRRLRSQGEGVELF